MSTNCSSSSTLDHEKDHDIHEPAPVLGRDLHPVATDPLELPYRTLTENADMGEYTQETATGLRLHVTKSNRTGKEEKYELVTFTIDDKENPKNWSKPYKWWCTMVVAFTCFTVAFNSAVITADLVGVEDTFGVSEEVALLTITMFVVGFGVGPMGKRRRRRWSSGVYKQSLMLFFAAFAPFSETFGRKPIYASTLLIAVIFVIPCAVAKNIGTLLVCRLIDGIAFSGPMVLVGGTLADLWRAEERGIPMAAFSAAPFIGPAIGMFQVHTIRPPNQS